MAEEGPERRLAQKVDGKIGRHRQRHRPDMGEDRHIGGKIGEGEEGRAGNRAARPQMVMRRVEPQHRFAGADVIDAVDAAIGIDLREFAFKKAFHFADAHDRGKDRGRGHGVLPGLSICRL